MSFVNATQLLLKAAQHYQKEKQTFSREEISKRINEIKYLSAQKKVPKLTLRKEIIHLENKLQGVYELERKMLSQKRQESAKVTALKRQNAELQKKLATAEDKDMQKKVEKLTQLLGEYTAQKGVKEDVALALAEAKGMRTPLPAVSTEEPGREVMQQRLEALQDRLKMLKQEVEINKELKKKIPPPLEKSVETIQQKLNEMYTRYPQLRLRKLSKSAMAASPVIERKEVKHTLLFDTPPVSTPEDENLELEKELPLPPPPKMKKD